MNELKSVAAKEGQSATNPAWKCKICILEIPDNHYAGFSYCLAATGLTHGIEAGLTKEEALEKCMSWANQTIPDCVFEKLN